MAYKYFLGLNTSVNTSVKKLEAVKERLMDDIKIIQCFIYILNKPNYNLDLELINGKWHFNFCEKYDLNSECKCLKFCEDIEQLFNIVENVFDHFNMFILCKNFKLFDINGKDFVIDSTKDLLVKYKNDDIFINLYECLSKPDKRKYINSSIMPTLEELKVKRCLFDKLLIEWMQNPIDKYVVCEQIYLYPHLAALYRKNIENYSRFLKVKDLVKVLQRVNEPIELEIKHLHNDKGQVLSVDEFEKSLTKIEGDKILNNEIFQNENQMYYISALRICNENNSMHRIPLYLYRNYDELIDTSKIAEKKLNIVNGYHFDFCSNIKKKFCNCLKYLSDNKLLDIIEQYSQKFQMKVLSENFEYFDIAMNSMIELLDEVFNNEDFYYLYKILEANYDLHQLITIPLLEKSREGGLHNVKQTIIPLLEKLKVRRRIFIELLDVWKNDYIESIQTYPHLMNLHKSLIKETSQWLLIQDLIKVLGKINEKSKIYLEINTFLKFQEYNAQIMNEEYPNKLDILTEECGKIKQVSKFEGYKKEIIERICQKYQQKDEIEIKQLKIDDDDEYIFKIPYHLFVVFDEVGCSKKIYN